MATSQQSLKCDHLVPNGGIAGCLFGNFNTLYQLQSFKEGVQAAEVMKQLTDIKTFANKETRGT
jgi:hypothetical protein